MSTLLRAASSLVLALSFAACGQAEIDSAQVDPAASPDYAAQAGNQIYMFDQFNFAVPLNPFPLGGADFTCINLPATADNLISSFRITSRTRFYDGPNCTSTVYVALTSGNMPVVMNNRATSIMFTP